MEKPEFFRSYFVGTILEHSQNALLEDYAVEILRSLKCTDHLSNQTLFEFRGVGIAEDDEKIGANIARTA